MNKVPLIVFLLFPILLSAHESSENHLDNGVMHVHTREFLLGDLHVGSKATTDPSTHFMVRSSIWLRGFLDNDPVLRLQDFDMRRTEASSFTGARYMANQMALAPSPPSDCKHCYFDLELDPSLQVDGYNTYSNVLNTLKFLPKDSRIAHGFRCQLDRSADQNRELSICSVVVVYPYDTNIVLNGRRMRPGTVAEYGSTFSSIAERMLEVVICIDITDQQTAERSTELSELLEHYPNLEGCEVDLTG